MALNLHHELSSSDNESETGISTRSTTISSSQVLKAVEEIISENKLMKCNINQLTAINQLFDHDITEDDDIWLVQTPKDMDIHTLTKTNLDFDSTISNLKCKMNKKRRKYNVYAMSTIQRRINLALPSKKAKSVLLNSYPLAGRIILQENLRQENKSESVLKNVNDIVKFDGSRIEIKKEVIDEVELIDELAKKKKKIS